MSITKTHLVVGVASTTTNLELSSVPEETQQRSLPLACSSLGKDRAMFSARDEQIGLCMGVGGAEGSRIEVVARNPVLPVSIYFHASGFWRGDVLEANSAVGPDRPKKRHTAIVTASRHSGAKKFVRSKLDHRRYQMSFERFIFL